MASELLSDLKNPAIRLTSPPHADPRSALQAPALARFAGRVESLLKNRFQSLRPGINNNCLNLCEVLHTQDSFFGRLAVRLMP
jgi:hypothetical protein